MDAVLVRLAEPPALSPSGEAARGNGRQAELLLRLARMGLAPATQRVARAGRLPTGGPQHAAARRKLQSFPGARPAKVKQK